MYQESYLTILEEQLITTKGSSRREGIKSEYK